MSSLKEIIQNHLEYEAWANTRLLDAVQGLTAEQLQRDFGSADKSVKGTLVHLFRAARTWLLRLEEGTPGSPWGTPEDEEWPALRSKWDDVQQRWLRWGAGLGESDAVRMVKYTDLKGNPWSQPVWEIVLHVVNHGTHHRGQVSGFLRASGVVPPPLDFIAFARQRAR